MEGISSVKIYNAPVKNSVNQERQRTKNYNTQVKTSVNQEQQHVTNPNLQAFRDNLQAFRDFNKKLTKVNAIISAVGFGICGLLCCALYMLNPKAKKLAKHIDFSPAKTLEEAMKFGKKNFEIKKYEGFEATDLGVVNWINEGLTNVSNISHGKVVMPRKVVFTQDIDPKYVADVSEIGVMRFSKSDAKGVCDRVKRHLDIEELLDKQAKISRTNKLSFSDMTHTQIRKYYSDKIASSTYTYCSPFSIVHHEMGHLQHRANYNCSSFLNFLKKGAKSTSFNDINEKYAKLFDNSKDVARSVSEYATTNPAEFVAECYSAMVDEKLCNKTILSDEARELYKKLGGAQI